MLLFDFDDNIGDVIIETPSWFNSVTYLEIGSYQDHYAVCGGLKSSLPAPENYSSSPIIIVVDIYGNLAPFTLLSGSPSVYSFKDFFFTKRGYTDLLQLTADSLALISEVYADTLFSSQIYVGNYSILNLSNATSSYNLHDQDTISSWDVITLYNDSVYIGGNVQPDTRYSTSYNNYSETLFEIGEPFYPFNEIIRSKTQIYDVAGAFLDIDITGLDDSKLLLTGRSFYNLASVSRRGILALTNNADITNSNTNCDLGSTFNLNSSSFVYPLNTPKLEIIELNLAQYPFDLFDETCSRTTDIYFGCNVNTFHKYNLLDSLTGGIENLGGDFGIDIYPNPSGDIINVSVNEVGTHFQDSQISIFDINGRLVASYFHVDSKNGVYSLDISKLNSGVYTLYVKSLRGAAQSLRFVKI